MKNLSKYISEKLIVNKGYEDGRLRPTTRTQLDDLIIKRVQNSYKDYLDLTDIDVSKVSNFYKLFWEFEFKVIDISGWDTSHVKTMEDMFKSCDDLEDIIGIENFTFDNCVTISYIFAHCKKLNITKKIQDWKIDRNKTKISAMLWDCPTDPPKCLRDIK